MMLVRTDHLRLLGAEAVYDTLRTWLDHRSHSPGAFR